MNRPIDERRVGRPHRHVRLSILVTALVSASCVVPVDVPQPGSGSGVVSGPCSVPDDLGPLVAGRTRVFEFPGCATATFSSEPGVSVVTRPNADGSATVEITPSQVGIWVLTLVANDSTQTRDVVTGAEYDADAGFFVRYPDRLDAFVRTVSPSGRLLVALNQEQFAVYGRDGGVEQTINASVSSFAWAGNTLWALRPGLDQKVERWVDTPAGLVSEGTIDVTNHSYCVFCRVEENQIETMISNDLVQFTWDAGVSARQIVSQGIQLQSQFNRLIRDGTDKVWADDFCSYERGCTSTLCPAIQACVYRPGDALMLWADDAHAIVLTGPDGMLGLWELPLSKRRRVDWTFGGTTRVSRSKDERVVIDRGDGIASEIIPHRNRLLRLDYPGRADTYVITNRWIVRFLTPREAQFIRR